jgi:hypothetical protein
MMPENLDVMPWLIVLGWVLENCATIQLLLVQGEFFCNLKGLLVSGMFSLIVETQLS